jgi:hypothetical protein
MTKEGLSLMAQANTTATLDGNFKAVYGDGIVDLTPDNAILSKMIKFKESERIGKSYQVPVILSAEHGCTYLAAGDGVQTLNASVAATLKNATVDGAQIILRGQIDYEAAAKAAGNKQAFKNSTELMVENLIESAARRLETMFLYGGTGLATVASLSTQVITLATGSHASGIWAGMEGASIDVYTSGGSVRQAGLVISSMDLDARTLTVVGTTTGIVSTDVVYFAGAKGKECNGLDAILTNNTSMFGIDASAFSLWRSSSYAAGGAALTQAKVNSAVQKAVAKGGLNEDVVVLVNPLTWGNLNTDQAALRQYTNPDSTAKNGFEAIEYRGMSGKMSVVAHPMVKEGEAFVFPPKRMKRVGAQELSFETPGRKGEIFLHIPDKNAYELRIYGNQSLFCEALAKAVKITGIVNS